MSAKPIPDDYHSITPYLLVEDAGAVSTFAQEAFGATERGRVQRPDGTVMHMEIAVGDSVVMVGEPMGEFGPAPAHLFLYVEDCDAVFAKAIEAGGAPIMEVTTMAFSGERYGGVLDPAGNVWWVGTHVEDVSWEETQRRADALADQRPKG